jgi:HAD superfamily hydrolase (TIGR01509 family)
MQDGVTDFSQVDVAFLGEAGRQPIRGAVFDCDGLLLNTAEIWWAAYEATAESLGRSLNGADPASFNGMSVSLAAERLGKSLGCAVSEVDLLERLRTLVGHGPIAAMPGATVLLETLVGQMPLGVATNAPLDVAEAALQSAGLLDFFDLLVSAEHGGVPKPAPDVYLEACRLLALKPAEAVAFEDSAMGATAARDAGMTVVAVPSDDSGIDADLIVSRLDDPGVFALLGLAAPAADATNVGSNGELRGPVG